MKLNYRYTLAYAFITFFVLSIGFAIVYAALSRSVTQATIGQLAHLNAVVAGQLRSGRDYSTHPSRANVSIRPLAAPGPPLARTVQVRNEWDATWQAQVEVVRLTTYLVLRGQAYAITSKAAVVKPADIYFTGLVLVFAWTFVFLIALVVILSEVISWHILKPFNTTLRGIELFQLGQKATLPWPPAAPASLMC